MNNVWRLLTLFVMAAVAYMVLVNASSVVNIAHTGAMDFARLLVVTQGRSLQQAGLSAG